MHWSEKVAQHAIERIAGNRPIVVSSGVSLSGPVHVGHSREFITAALVCKAIERQGRRVRFIAFVDDMDPLKKVYSFLSPAYKRWIGCPLSSIPDPFGCHVSYADHFLMDLLESFELLGMSPEVIRSSDRYGSGSFTNLVMKSLIQREEVGAIINRITGKQGDDRWPFMAKCPCCFSIRKTRIKSMDGNMLSIHCDTCYQDFSVNLNHGNGKLTWRCDWPMRWASLGVDVEPFGEDHNVAGGSYDSGQALAEAIYAVPAPIGVPYSWVHFKTGGAMHSSLGNAVPVIELAKAYPPEIIWWMFARRDPMTVVQFDPEQSILDETRLFRDAVTGKREYAEGLNVIRSSTTVSPSITAYPFDHLVMVAQLSNFNSEMALQILRRSKAYKDSKVPVDERALSYIRVWLDRYGKSYQICIRASHESVVDARTEFTPLIRKLRTNLQDIEWEAQSIHDTVHDVAKLNSVAAKGVFVEIYRYLIGQNRGPKIGWLMETLGKAKILELLRLE